MTSIPSISVQLVHIHGPLKGEIQEFSESEIRIGRHPDCQVSFPRDMTTLSRVHASIVREGNRFKLVDQSTNGTFVNGKKIADIYLKDGDVVMFAEGGPKVSFLTQTKTQSAQPPIPSAPSAQPERIPQPASAAPRPSAPVQAPPSIEPAFHRQTNPVPVNKPSQAESAPKATDRCAPSAGPQNIKAPFAIQYGPALKSFQTLPIVIGNGPSCDFVIQHPGLHDRHAQISFSGEHYCIRDLTGAQNILIDSRPITEQAPLEPDMQVALSAAGPKFRFIAGGRFVEIEDSAPEASDHSPTTDPIVMSAASQEGLGKKAGTLLKKFFGKES
jgi:predicted component of type VI protein secretion system